MIVDKQGRYFRNLRVSMTAACNYACTYCVPEGYKRQKAKKPLDANQLLHAVSLLTRLNPIEKIRITGGEPLISEHFDDFLKGLPVASYRDVSLTTNGQLLAGKVPLIAGQGVRRINVSLDTLDPKQFRLINRGGDLKSVLHGIETALSAGLVVKINMVPTRTANIDQVIALLDFCLERNIELRFIELMKMGHLLGSSEFSRDFVPMDYLLREIANHHTFQRAEAEFDSTSMRFEIPGKGFFGVIANESEPFCGTCTRLRLSSSGYLHGCLSSSNKHFIGDILSLAEDEALLVLEQRLTHVLADKQPTAFSGAETIMRRVGG